MAGALAGCGGGSDDEDLSTQDYIAKADAICAQYTSGSASREQQFNQALKSSDLESAAQDFEDQAADVTAMLDQLEGLTAPVEDQTTVTEIISLGRQRVDAAKDAADAIASGDKDAMIAAGKRGSVLAGKYDQLADGFGFTACGSGGAAATTGTTGDAGTTGTSGDTGATGPAQ
jgi:hypothetical protein